MRKLIATCLVTFAAFPAFADMCPNPGLMFVKDNGRYELNIPGWRVAVDSRLDKSSVPHFTFGRASWDLLTDTSNTVICSYAPRFEDSGAGYVFLESIAKFPEAAFKAHSRWYLSTRSNPRQYLCYSGYGGKDTTDCAFN